MSKPHFDWLSGGLTKRWVILGLVLLLGMANFARAATFTGNVSTLWSVPGNWDPIGVPTVAEIPSGKVVDIDIAATVSSLTTQPNSVIRASGGSITVTGTFTCNGGQMGSASSPFPLNISPSATMFVAASNAHRWDAVTINNAGKFEWAGGDLRCSAQINNSGMLLIKGDGFFGETGIGGLIVNTGQIIKSTGSGTTSLYGFNGNDYRLMRINNTTGTIAVASGTLEIGAGEFTGSHEVGPQHTLRVTGGPSNWKNVTLTGGGTLEINAVGGPEIRLIGTIDVGLELKIVTNVTAGDGGAQSQAILTGGGQMTWVSGGIGGKLILGSDFRTVITGGAGKGASDLTNRGTMSWFGPGPIGGLIQNEGIFDLLAAGTFTSYGLGCNLQNSGTFNTFSGGTNTSEAATFVNSGLVNVGGYGKAGILHILLPNGFQQTAKGSLYLEVGGTNAATPEFDQMTGNGKAIDGTLTVSLINGFNPATDARFTLITQQTGVFSEVHLPGFNRFKIEYPGNSKTDLVSLNDVPIPPLLWSAGRDLLRNESPDNATESEAVNHTLPQWTYGYRADGQGPGQITPFAPQEHINDASGLHGWIRPDTATLGVNTKNTPIIFDSGSGNYAPLLPSQIYMNAGNDGRLMIARWTAPESGNYRVLAEFLDLDGHGGDGITFYFVVNGFIEAQDTLKSTPEYFEQAKIRASTFHVNAGSHIEFMLSPGLDKSFDATAFNAIIRRVPTVNITSPASDVELQGGAQNVTVDVDVENVIQASKVTLTIDGAENVVSDTTAPFSLTTLLKPGYHWITAVAVDAGGAVVESPGIAVIVAPPSAQQAATKLEKRGGDSSFDAAAIDPGNLFYSSGNGSWHDPATWGNGGVPGRWDYAVIQNGHTVQLEFGIEVRGLTINGALGNAAGAGPKPQLDVYGNLFAAGQIENVDLYINGPAGKFLVLQPSLVLRSVNLINQSSMIISADQFDAQNVTIENRGSIKAGPPITSQGPLELPLTGYNQAGGLLVLDINTTLSAPHGTQLNGTVLLSPGYSPSMDPNGPNVVSNHGGHLVGLDGGTLVGLDAGTLLSDGGGGLVGNDGGTIVGPTGAPLVGNDGGTLVARPGAFKNRSPASPEATQGDILLIGGTVSGTGELRGNVINQGAVIMPGHSAGGIVVIGNYTQQAGGTLVLEKGGKTFDPFTYDIFEVTGTANLGGNLIVKTINGYTPTSGDTISPILYGSHTGNFAGVTSNAQVTLGANAGTIDVTGTNPPSPKALNIATRMKVETGDNVLIAGFIITGSQPKKVIIRGIGPSLAFGGVLADPTLNLDNGAVTNDNWRTSQEQEIIATTIPPSHNLESAIVATLNPGPHTAILAGAGGATGIGVIEVYDLESGSPVQLANISSRGFVQTGDNVMIGGFIIGGTYSTKVIVRAIGPSLPIPGILADPTLELVDQNGGRISNDNWRDSQEAEIIATTIPPTHNNESAIVATLAPGAYTAIVRGVDDATGIAVVEAYNLQ